jgi:hypothetical protein
LELISLPPDDVDFMLGDTLTESLQNILYSTYDGDLNLLQGVIENPFVDVFVRGSVLDVLGQLYLDGEITKEYLVAYLRKLIDRRSSEQEMEETFTGLVQDIVIECQLVEMLEDIRNLHDEGRVDQIIFGDFDEFLESYQGDHGQRVRYIEDVIEEMHWWASFQDTEGMSAEESFANQSVHRLKKIALSLR